MNAESQEGNLDSLGEFRARGCEAHPRTTFAPHVDRSIRVEEPAEEPGKDVQLSVEEDFRERDLRGLRRSGDAKRLEDRRREGRMETSRCGALWALRREGGPNSEESEDETIVDRPQLRVRIREADRESAPGCVLHAPVACDQTGEVREVRVQSFRQSDRLSTRLRAIPHGRCYTFLRNFCRVREPEECRERNPMAAVPPLL